MNLEDADLCIVEARLLSLEKLTVIQRFVLALISEVRTLRARCEQLRIWQRSACG